MSLHDFTPNNAATPSDFAIQDLDQALESLWTCELEQYSQTIQQRLTPAAPTRQRPSREARRRKVHSASATPTATKQIAPQRLKASPTTDSRILRQKRLARNQTAAGWFKAAGVAVGVVGLSMGSYQWVKSYQQSRELPPIRQVMYQNAQTKIAAFRKEISAGEHYVADAERPIEYIAQPGDTVAKISQKFHVTPNTIVKNNERSKINDVIEPGTKLSILPVDGIAHPVEKHETLAELSKRYRVNVQKIVDANQLDNPHMITEKQKIIIPNATELKRRPEPKPVMASIRAAATGKGAPMVKTATGRRLSWPAAGIVTSNYGWRWFRMHNGMDVAGPVGTPIKAVKEGRVAYSGWMGGYGYCIDIDHGNGVVTRYGHNSALQVQAGQYVHRGQQIASMGSTGHSTGPHLHFEVHVNGSPVDPRGYF